MSSIPQTRDFFCRLLQQYNSSSWTRHKILCSTMHSNQRSFISAKCCTPTKIVGCCHKIKLLNWNCMLLKMIFVHLAEDSKSKKKPAKLKAQSSAVQVHSCSVTQLLLFQLDEFDFEKTDNKLSPCSLRNFTSVWSNSLLHPHFSRSCVILVCH